VKWGAESFGRWVSEKRISHTSLVPTQVHDLVECGTVAAGSLRAVVVGGGRLEPAVGRAARELGWPVLPSYGLTEAGSQVATAGLDSLEGSYREAPLPVLPIWELRVGGGGRLSLRGEALFIGRLVGEEGSFEPREGDWFETDDFAEITAAGAVIPLGRADSQVKVLGELVDPLAIERVLQMADSQGGWGKTAVVVALPDTRIGHRLVAVVEGEDPQRVRRALDDYNARVAGFARVGETRGVAKFPRSGLGKVMRGELAAAVGEC